MHGFLGPPLPIATKTWNGNHVRYGLCGSMLIRWVSWLTPMSLVRSGLIISWIASAFAAAGMYKICAKVYDGRVGMILAGLMLLAARRRRTT